MSRFRLLRPLLVATGLALVIGSGVASRAAPTTADEWTIDVASTFDRGPAATAAALEPDGDEDGPTGAFSCQVMGMMAGASAELAPD